MKVSESLGELQYLRMKASWFVETARAWIMPGAAAGAFTKYLGFETYQAVLAALLIAPIFEGGGYLLGRFMWEHGGTEREYQMSLDRDPWKRQSLAAYADMIRLLEQACRPCWERVADPAKGNEWAESVQRNPRSDER